MRKFLVIIMLSLILSGGVYANPESIKKDGFVIQTNKWNDKIKINENLIQANQGDILIQKGVNRDVIGIYIDYDFVNKELLYLKVQDEFTGSLINGKINNIINLFDDTEVSPQTSAESLDYQINFTTELSIKSAYLLFDYVLLDTQERYKFYNNKLEYIIEQIQYNGEKTINNNIKDILQKIKQ